MLDAQGYLYLVMLLVLAWLAGYVMTRLGYPALIGELAVGVIMGPPVLNILSNAPGERPGPLLGPLGTLGTIFLMLLVGARIDARDLAKASGSALLIAAGSFAASFAVGYFATTALFDRPTNEGLIMGVAVSNTALATLPRILLDLDLIETRVGQFLAAVSLLTVAILLTVFAVVDSVVKAGGVDFGRLGTVLLKAAIFLTFAVARGLLLFPRLRPLLARAGLTGRSHSFAVAIFIGLLYAGLALLAGLAVILGAFMAGLFLRDDMFPEGEFPALLTSIEDVTYRFLAPIFFVSAGFSVKFSVFQTSLVPLLVILIGALLAKPLAGFILSRLSPLSFRESVVLGAGMNAKGGVDIVVAQAGLSARALSQEFYTIVLFLAAFGGFLTPVMLKFGRDWLQRKGALTKAGAPEPTAVATATAEPI
jgi:Kef-type K+ transport system membrane component KefB